MIKLLTILFLLIGFGLNAQVIVPSGSSGMINQYYRLSSLLGLKIPVYNDTTAANTNIGKDSLGLLIQIRSTGFIYNRDTTAGGHKWTLQSSSLSQAYISITSLNDSTYLLNRANGISDTVQFKTK